MAAVDDDLPAAAPHAIDERIPHSEYPCVEDLVVRLAGKRWMFAPKRQNVRDRADGEPAAATRQRLGAAGPDRLKHRPAA